MASSGRKHRGERRLMGDDGAGVRRERTRLDLVERLPAQLGEGHVLGRLDGALQRARPAGHRQQRVPAATLVALGHGHGHERAERARERESVEAALVGERRVAAHEAPPVVLALAVAREPDAAVRREAGAAHLRVGGRLNMPLKWRAGRARRGNTSRRALLDTRGNSLPARAAAAAIRVRFAPVQPQHRGVGRSCGRWEGGAEATYKRSAYAASAASLAAGAFARGCDMQSACACGAGPGESGGACSWN